jgi:hypothetical protein
MAAAAHQQAHNGHGQHGSFGAPGGSLPQNDPYRQGRKS